jgi:Uma2 family endonuclease
MPVQALLTAREFAALTNVDDQRLELIDGELQVLPSPTLIHNKIRHALENLVGDYVETNVIGGVVSEYDCAIDEGTVRRPDVGVFIGSRWSALDAATVPAPFAPDIVIEILSPSEGATIVNRKVNDYFRAGAREVWLLDHEGGELHRRTPNHSDIFHADDEVTTPLLPGFHFTLREVLEQVRRKLGSVR